MVQPIVHHNPMQAFLLAAQGERAGHGRLAGMVNKVKTVARILAARTEEVTAGLGIAIGVATVAFVAAGEFGATHSVLGAVIAGLGIAIGARAAGGVAAVARAAGVEGAVLAGLGIAVGARAALVEGAAALVAVQVTGILGRAAAERNQMIEGFSRKNKAFCQAVLQDYLSSLSPDFRKHEIEDFQGFDSEAIEKFPRLVIQELIRAPEIPTLGNTPAFLHQFLVNRQNPDGSPKDSRVVELRNRFQRLSLEENQKFSLLGEPRHEQMTEDLFKLVADARLIAGELSCARGNDTSWMLTMSESARDLRE